MNHLPPPLILFLSPSLSLPRRHEYGDEVVAAATSSLFLSHLIPISCVGTAVCRSVSPSPAKKL